MANPSPPSTAWWRRVKLLLDEHLSPRLTTRCAEFGVFAQSVVHLNLHNTPDSEIWNYACDHDFTVVTTNARDFLLLLEVDIHPGLILLRESGLTRAEQWDRLARVLEYIAAQPEPGANYMVNRVIEIRGLKDPLVVRQIPRDPITG